MQSEINEYKNNFENLENNYNLLKEENEKIVENVFLSVFSFFKKASIYFQIKLLIDLNKMFTTFTKIYIYIIL